MIKRSTYAAKQSWRFSNGQDLQVKTVQVVSEKHTGRWLGTQWSQCKVIFTSHCPHSEVQVMLLLRFGAGRIPAGRRALPDAGSAQLTVQVIDQTQQPVRLCLQETLPDGAFEKVLQASAGAPLLLTDLTLGSRWGHI